jgi:hypothetical protein
MGASTGSSRSACVWWVDTKPESSGVRLSEARGGNRKREEVKVGEHIPSNNVKPPSHLQLPHPRATVRSPRKPNHCLSLTSD